MYLVFLRYFLSSVTFCFFLDRIQEDWVKWVGIRLEDRVIGVNIIFPWFPFFVYMEESKEICFR